MALERRTFAPVQKHAQVSRKRATKSSRRAQVPKPIRGTRTLRARPYEVALGSCAGERLARSLACSMRNERLSVHLPARLESPVTSGADSNASGALDYSRRRRWLCVRSAHSRVVRHKRVAADLVECLVGRSVGRSRKLCACKRDTHTHAHRERKVERAKPVCARPASSWL